MSSLPTTAEIVVHLDWVEGGHMNAARYFDQFVKEGYLLMDHFDMGPEYTAMTQHQFFTAEARISYFKEVQAGDRFVIRLRLLEVSRVAALVLLELLDSACQRVAATMEELFVHVDLRSRRTASIPGELRTRMQAAVLEQRVHPLPAGHRRLLSCQRGPAVSGPAT